MPRRSIILNLLMLLQSGITAAETAAEAAAETVAVAEAGFYGGRMKQGMV